MNRDRSRYWMQRELKKIINDPETLNSLNLSEE